MHPLTLQLIARAQFWSRFARQPTMLELKTFCLQSQIPQLSLLSNTISNTDDPPRSNQNGINEPQEQVTLSL